MIISAYAYFPANILSYGEIIGDLDAGIGPLLNQETLDALNNAFGGYWKLSWSTLANQRYDDYNSEIITSKGTKKEVATIDGDIVTFKIVAKGIKGAKNNITVSKLTKGGVSTRDAASLLSKALSEGKSLDITKAVNDKYSQMLTPTSNATTGSYKVSKTPIGAFSYTSGGSVVSIPANRVWVKISTITGATQSGWTEKIGQDWENKLHGEITEPILSFLGALGIKDQEAAALAETSFNLAKDRVDAKLKIAREKIVKASIVVDDRYAMPHVNVPQIQMNFPRQQPAQQYQQYQQYQQPAPGQFQQQAPQPYQQPAPGLRQQALELRRQAQGLQRRAHQPTGQIRNIGGAPGGYTQF